MTKVWLKSKLQNLAMKKKEAYVTRSVTLPRIDADSLLSAAARNSGIGRGTLIAACDAINKEFTNFVMIGHPVELPHIGSFRFRINAKASDSEVKEPSKVVIRKKLYFQCNKELWRQCQVVPLELIPEKDTEDEGEDTPTP